MPTSYSITPQSIKDFIIRLVRSLRPYQTTLEVNNQDWLRINDWFNKYELSPVSSPLSIDDFYSIYLYAVEEENRRRQAEAQEEGSLDPDPDLTDGDDDLQNGTVPPPSDKFNESLRANVEALDEAFNQIITQLEERGVPEEEIEAFRKAVTPVYEGFGSRTMGQPGGSIPIDIPDSPMPKWERGTGVSITIGDPDNPNSGNDDIYITLHLELPVIGPLLETLGVGGGKIYLRKAGKWSTPGDVLERVGGVFADILKTPKAILDEAKTIIEGIEDGTVFEGIKKGEGLFADLLKKWLIGRYPWFEDEWFKDFIKQSEELARQSGLLTLSELDTEEKCNATGTHIWDDTTKSCKEAEPKEVTEDVVPPPEKTEEECLAEGNDWDGEKCVFVPEDEKKAKCLARGGTWENGQCTLPPVDPQQVCAQRGGRWDPLANNGEGGCITDDGGGGDDDPACENGTYNKTLERCECNFGWVESADGKSCEKVVCDETTEQLSEDGKSCVLKKDDGGGGDDDPACENGTYDPDSDECVCNTGYTFARDGETGVPFCKPDDTTPQCTLPNTVWSDEAKDCVCKDGYENVGENGELVCQLIDGGGDPVTPQCPANATWDKNLDDCVCNAGFTKSADGKSCVPDGLPPSGTCPAGQVKDPETGECVDAPPPPTSGGGGGGGMFSPQSVNLAGGINYALPPFVQVDYTPQQAILPFNPYSGAEDAAITSLNKVLYEETSEEQDSLFKTFIG
tara:strand:- start:1710 stop:3923 length:2214 start_codon:yes stop_codon:yes gene_type:complete